MLIFLYGEDSLRSSQKLQEIKARYLESDKSGSGLSLFDVEVEKESANKIINALSMSNLLAPKRLVIIKNLILGSQTLDAKLEDYFKKNLEKISEGQDLVVILWEREFSKKTSSFFKLIEKKAKSQNFEKLTGVRLSQWILKEIKEIDNKGEISKQALEKLVVYVGEDPILLRREIQKLLNFSNGKMISEKDIELLVRAKIDSDIFRTIDAIGANDKKEALKLIHRHLEKGEDSFYLFSMLIYQFRNMLKIADLKESGNLSEYEIAKIAKLHPFVVKKSLLQLRRFNLKRLEEIYANLGEIDLKIKTGRLDIRLAMDKFVVEL